MIDDTSWQKSDFSSDYITTTLKFQMGPKFSNSLGLLDEWTCKTQK